MSSSEQYPEWHWHAILDVAFRWNIPADDAEIFLEDVGLIPGADED
jgi:hypothetical protein